MINSILWYPAMMIITLVLMTIIHNEAPPTPKRCQECHTEPATLRTQFSKPEYTPLYAGMTKKK